MFFCQTLHVRVKVSVTTNGGHYSSSGGSTNKDHPDVELEQLENRLLEKQNSSNTS